MPWLPLVGSTMTLSGCVSGPKVDNAPVAALDLNEEAVTGLAAELTDAGFICKGYKADVLDGALLETVHRQVLSDLGPCDILLNGAGGNNPRATTDNEYQHRHDYRRYRVLYIFSCTAEKRCCPRDLFPYRFVGRLLGNVLRGCCCLRDLNNGRYDYCSYFFIHLSHSVFCGRQMYSLYAIKQSIMMNTAEIATFERMNGWSPSVCKAIAAGSTYLALSS